MAEAADVTRTNTRRREADVSTSRDHPEIWANRIAPTALTTSRNRVEERPSTKRAAIIQPSDNITSTRSNRGRPQDPEFDLLENISGDLLNPTGSPGRNLSSRGAHKVRSRASRPRRPLLARAAR